MYLIRFADVECPTCTITVDLVKVRGIGMLLEDDGYYVRLSFDAGDTVVVRRGLSHADALALRNKLENMWYGTASSSYASVETVDL